MQWPYICMNCKTMACRLFSARSEGAMRTRWVEYFLNTWHLILSRWNCNKWRCYLPVWFSLSNGAVRFDYPDIDRIKWGSVHRDSVQYSLPLTFENHIHVASILSRCVQKKFNMLWSQWFFGCNFIIGSSMCTCAGALFHSAYFVDKIWLQSYRIDTEHFNHI